MTPRKRRSSLTDGERKQIVRTATETRRRGERLVTIGERLQRDAGDLEALLGKDGAEVLKGAAITDKLVELTEPGEEWHFKELFDLLHACGYQPNGVTPINTMLTAINRSDRFVAVGNRSGRYRTR